VIELVASCGPSGRRMISLTFFMRKRIIFGKIDNESIRGLEKTQQLLIFD